MIDINKNAISLVQEERLNHSKLGFTEEHDDKLTDGQLMYLAQYCIFSNDEYLPKKGWDMDYLRQLHLKSKEEQLVIGASILCAEIDRRLRILRNALKELQEKENQNEEVEDNI